MLLEIYTKKPFKILMVTIKQAWWNWSCELATNTDHEVPDMVVKHKLNWDNDIHI